MKLLEKILFAADFSEDTKKVQRQCEVLAKIFFSEVILIHVVPDTQNALLPPEIIKQSASEKLQELKAELSAKGINVIETILDVGSAYDKIIQYSELHDVNVILVGSGQVTISDQFKLGITTEKLIRKSDKPVWVVTPDAKIDLQKILCPVDFSEPSRRALENAIHLARHFNISLDVIHIVQPLSSIYRLVSRIPSFNDLQEEWTKQSENKFRTFLTEFSCHNVSQNHSILYGEPHHEILNYVRKNKIDLVIMGSVGSTGLFKTQIGTVAEKVVREIPCSTIMVKSEHAIKPKLEKEISDIREHFQQGKEFLEKGFAKEALAHFKSCISADRLFVPAWQGLSVAYKRLGDEKESLRCDEIANQINQTLWQQKVQSDVRKENPVWRKKKFMT
jgi:nucleotide-binding universal stress UspA family protein